MALSGSEQQAQVSRPGDWTMGLAKDAIGCTLLLPDGSQVYATLFQGAFLCLHEQPFGFTREDVEDERAELSFLADTVVSISYDIGINGMKLQSVQAKLRGLVERKEARIGRIEALLPPEKE